VKAFAEDLAGGLLVHGAVGVEGVPGDGAEASG
jgi:hypothetical protein